MSNWIGKQIQVDGFTIKDWNDISRKFIIADIESDMVRTECGHTIDLSGDRTVWNKNNRRVMVEARIDWDNAE